MKQFFITLSLLVITWLSGFGQHSIQSMVFDAKNGLALEMATVRLINPVDSSLVQGVRTNEKGAFYLSKVKPGDYKLLVSMVGYIDYSAPVKVESKDLLLRHIRLQENSQLLKEVEVKGTAAQLVVKNDTTEYNATAFKTQENAVVEELLKKMPGVEVSADGKITVNGQEIKKIRVDGKKFFDGDIEMATKNIPADMIEKVQVYENKSDMAKLTGFEDNDTERIINLTTKPNRKRGIFGNVVGGVGSDLGNETNDFRYDSNAFINIMNNGAQTAITGGANNTNTTRSSRGRGGMGSPSGGITETQNLGVNNNTTVNKKLTLGGDGSFNHSDNFSKTETSRKNFLKESTDSTYSKSNSNIENYMANMRLEMEWKPDTLNTIIVQPNMNYNRSFSESQNNYTYMSLSDPLNPEVTSRGESHNHGNSHSIDAGLNVIVNHKFASKRGRTLTANIQTGITQTENESWANSYRKVILGDSTNIDQYINSNTKKYNASMRLSYVEPLWGNKSFLETAIAARTTSNESEKDQYKKDADGNYTMLDKDYSNTFKNKFYNETLEMNYRYVAQNYNLMLGIKAEPSQTYYNRSYLSDTTSGEVTLKVINISPTGRFQYNFGKKKFARIDYRGQTNQPNISQMQPVKNNTNQMNEMVGNPDLNPEFNHNLRLFYSAFNDVRFSSFNIMMNAQTTKDALVTNSIYDNTGKQFSQTLNAKTLPYSFNANIMYNTPLIQKKLHFNTNTSLSTSRRIGYSKKGLNTVDVDNMILGDLSDTHSYSAGEGLALTFTNDVIELGGRTSFRYSNSYNNLSNVTQNTYDWSFGGNFVAHLPYSFNVSSDVNYSSMQGYAGFDKEQIIWNGTLDKTFLRNKAVIALKVFDILHQKLNINQTISDNYISYSKFNTLTSYFIVSLSYKIDEFKGSGNRNRPDFNRFGPGGDDNGGGRRMRMGGGSGGFDGPPPGM
jgi:hypothetical protein